MSRASIIGAGIGGLVTAIGLQRQGWQVTVHERTAAPTVVGAGLSLFRNAFTALDSVGAGAAVRALGGPQHHLRAGQRRWDGRWLSVTPPEALRDLRYTVIHAGGAVDALRMLDAHPEIALLFTDVVMPELNGAQLAEAVRERRPGLPVLFTTGYARNAVVQNGLVEADMPVLAKPYTLEQLALKVRQAIVREAA